MPYCRYIWNIIVYLGVGNKKWESDSVSEDAVLTTIWGLEGRDHVIVTDNYFTSLALFMELMAHGFWAIGMVWKTQHGFPASLAGFQTASKPNRGGLVVRMHQDRAMCTIMWMDAKPVFLLSTTCNLLDPNSYAGK